MRVIAVANQKGGVGKTATTINLGAALAEAGRRVLLVDLDPQGHMTEALGVAEAPDEVNLARALLGEWAGELGELVTPYRDRLHIIATNMQMFLLEPQLYTRTGREWLLTRLLEAFAPAYDDCVIDCPPSLGALTDGALVAARRDDAAGLFGQVVIPVQSEDSTFRALRLLLRQVTSVQQVLRIDLEIAGMVINMLDTRRGNVVTSAREALEQHPTLATLAVIKDAKEIREVWRRQQSVIEHAPASAPAGWYRDLAKLVPLTGEPR